MKILYLVHQFFPEFQSGTERFILNIALNAQNYGHEVKVITYSFLDDETFSHDHGEILSKEYQYKGIPVIAYKYKKSEDNILNVLENENLRTFAITTIKFENPDIVHVGHIIRVHEFIWAAIELNIPYIITLTDFFLICPKVNLITSSGNLCKGPQGGNNCDKFCDELNNNYIKYRLSKAKVILKSASQLFAPSQFVVKIFRDEFSQLNIKTNPHGISRRYLAINKRKTLKQDQLFFGYMSSLTELKGISVILDAFKFIENKNIYLTIYGSGEENYVNRLVDSVKGHDRIHFLGQYNSEQLGNIYSQIDLLIIPSLCFETYSLVLHESLACNVPVIVSRIGALAEKIKDKKNGLTFLPGDSLDLRKKIEFIAAKPEIISTMKEYIKKKINIPTIEEEMTNYLKCYKKIIAS